MVIEESDFKLTAINDTSPFFDLEILKIVNKGKENEKKEFQNAGYGLTLESAIKRIAQYRVSNKIGDESISMATYMSLYKDTIKEIKELCNV